MIGVAASLEFLNLVGVQLHSSSIICPYWVVVSPEWMNEETTTFEARVDSDSEIEKRPKPQANFEKFRVSAIEKLGVWLLGSTSLMMSTRALDRRAMKLNG